MGLCHKFSSNFGFKLMIDNVPIYILQGWVSSGRNLFLPVQWKKLEETRFLPVSSGFNRKKPEETGRNLVKDLISCDKTFYYFFTVFFLTKCVFSIYGGRNRKKLDETCFFRDGYNRVSSGLNRQAEETAQPCHQLILMLF